MSICFSITLSCYRYLSYSHHSTNIWTRKYEISVFIFVSVFFFLSVSVFFFFLSVPVSVFLFVPNSVSVCIFQYMSLYYWMSHRGRGREGLIVFAVILVLKGHWTCLKNIAITDSLAFWTYHITEQNLFRFVFTFFLP